MSLGSDARGVVAGAIRGAAADAGDLLRALVEAFWYRRAIFDPPPWQGWPHRLRLFLPLRKQKR